MTEQLRLIGYLFYSLFNVDLSLQSKNQQLLSRYLFDSCQITTTWMSMRMLLIKLDTDCVCPGHLASNAQSLQENSQSEHIYYCSHIIKKFYGMVLFGIILKINESRISKMRC